MHGVQVHVHCNSHVGTIMSWGMEAWFHALIRVKNLLRLFDLECVRHCCVLYKDHLCICSDMWRVGVVMR